MVDSTREETKDIATTTQVTVNLETDHTTVGNPQEDTKATNAGTNTTAGHTVCVTTRVQPAKHQWKDIRRTQPKPTAWVVTREELHEGVASRGLLKPAPLQDVTLTRSQTQP